MIAFPNAKINIGLNVLGKRPDGFHEIFSCFYPIPWCDMLEITRAEELSFEAYGQEIPGDADQNLCLKAYKVLAADFDLAPVRIQLYKTIPTGAGLGGGSADAAFTLCLLNEKFELNLDDETLENYAASLGSDCPFFIRNSAAVVTGRGEFLEPIPLDLNGYYLSLINPGIHISTAEAYRNVTFSKPPSDRDWMNTANIGTWKERIQNDFEVNLFPAYPEIASLKAYLYESGAIYAAMSGSGSTVYALSNEEIDLGQYQDKGYHVFQRLLASP